MTKAARAVLSVQGAYYVVTGLLPVVSIRFFQWMTGPKTDLWLVRMVGLLAVAVGIVLALALRHRRVTSEILTLALLSALAFSIVDVTYVALHRIGRVYLADAAIEVAFAVVAAATLARGLSLRAG